MVLLPGLLTAGLLAAAAALAVPGMPDGRRLRRVTTAAAGGGAGGSPRAAPDQGAEDLITRHRGAIALMAGAAPAVMLGGAAGAVAGVVTAVVVYRAVGLRMPAHERRRGELVARSLPHVVDLLAVTLASGASPSAALAAVAAAVESPVAVDLRAAENGLRLGRDPVRVWRELARRPGLAPLGRAMARAVETGASVSEALHRLSEDLQGSARLEAERQARAVGVRAAAPLGLCLLPAFVLIGVVPLVASTVSGLLTP